MSGGHFDHMQYTMPNIIDEIENVIRNNNNTEVDQWGTKLGWGFSDETIEELKKAHEHLTIAFTYVQRIDWLLSGDDGEETFHERLKEDLTKIKDYGIME